LYERFGAQDGRYPDQIEGRGRQGCLRLDARKSTQQEASYPQILLQVPERMLDSQLPAAINCLRVCLQIPLLYAFSHVLKKQALDAPSLIGIGAPSEQGALSALFWVTDRVDAALGLLVVSDIAKEMPLRASVAIILGIICEVLFFDA